MLYTQCERLGDILDHLVEVELLLLEHNALLIEHRHLEHLLNKEAQALRLISDNTAEVLCHLLALGYAIVVHHLRSKRDRCDRSLELVSHIIDKVVLNLSIALLAEDYHDGEQEREP